MVKIGLAIMAGLALLLGCASERRFGAYNERDHTWMTDQGIMVEDRVSGHLIPPEVAIQREYLGEIYYFENEFDVAMFERDPGVYNYHGYQPQYAGGP
jgi:hypothetical protein